MWTLPSVATVRPSTRPAKCCRRQARRGGQAFTASCRDTARRHGLIVHGGSIGELDAGTLFNTSLVFGPDGAELGRLQKDPPVRHHHAERRGPIAKAGCFGAGREVVVAEAGRDSTGAVHLLRSALPGNSILALRRRGAAVIFVPSAFTRRNRPRPLGCAVAGPRRGKPRAGSSPRPRRGRHADAQGRPRENLGAIP